MRCAAMNTIIRVPNVFWLLMLVLLFAAKYSYGEPYKAEPGPHKVDTFLLDLHDDARARDVPVRVYLPQDAKTPRPLVLVSHGLGGSREGLSYLGNHFASHGYITVHMQHPGSDEAVWKGLPVRDVLPAMRKAAASPQVAIDRANDVPFVLDQLEKLNSNKDSKLAGLLDFDKVAIAGHSFGAWSAMAGVNMTVGGKLGKSYGDKRIKCTIPLSPPVANERQREATYATINVPALFMTGTLDTSPINDTTAEERLIPYSLVPGPSKDGAPKYLVNFDGADHMTFGGETKRNLRSKVSPKDNEAFHSIILQSSTAFLDCYLLDNADAKTWLNNGGFTETVGTRGTVEMDIKP